MSLGQKNNLADEILWQPTATLDALKTRAHILDQIRAFFKEKQVLEVETPLLCHYSVTDPHINSIEVSAEKAYLQTSPEYAMKRLLAAGSGSIYQICKAFRQDEQGRLHQPEFTLLEWYRVGFDHHQLMDEMDELLKLILGCQSATRLSYQSAFQKYLSINPLTASVADLSTLTKDQQINIASNLEDKDAWLNLLFVTCIEPLLGINGCPCFIYDFPASQAALAKLQSNQCAARFEVYYQGVELANGFHELQDAKEQRRRFWENNSIREQLGLPKLAIDERFLAALEHGLPSCAGVALGLDRLIMLALKHTRISTVMSFDYSRV